MISGARLWRRWIVALGLLAASAVAGTPASAADSVSAIKTARLASLPSDGAAPILVSLGGRPTVIQRRAAFVLAGDGRGWWPLDRRRLGINLSITESVSNGQQSVLLLGETGTVRRAAVLSLKGAELTARLLPPLPFDLGSARGAIEGESLVLAGSAPDGSSRVLTTPLTGSAQWTARSAWPDGGAPMALASQGAALVLALDSGRHWRWTAKNGWRARTAAPAGVVAGSSTAVGQTSILYFLAETSGGYVRLYSYNAITDAWSKLNHRQPAGASATLPFGKGMMTASQQNGQIEFSTAEVQFQRRMLGLLDWTVIGVYMAAMLTVGFYFYRRSKHGSSSEFFLGNRSIPFWAAGVSMFAGNTSSISYLAIPAKAFDTDWQYMMSKIITVMGLIFVAIWVVPIFRRLNLVSVFNYLEMRFHPMIRLLTSSLAIAMHVGGRMGIVLFLPAMAISIITGTNVILCISLLGICTIIYTALGGMRAVIWTDFIQVLVLMGGALFAIGFIINSVGVAPIFESATQFDKTKLLNLSFDFTQPTLWGFILLILFDTVLTFPKDQVLMQRALSTSSEKEAGRSVWFFAAVLLPGGFIFYFIGTMLFAYYRANPARLDPLLPIDAVFPSFIGTELPHGVTGLIIAGLFAAAMGTLSGTINSVATLLSVDFYEKFARRPTQKKVVRFAEWMSVVVGLVGIALAIFLSTLDIHSLLDLTIELFGLLGGSCAGAYTLGMFTHRANWQGTAIGIVTASVVTLAAWVMSLVHPYFYLLIAIVVSIVVGYAASLFFPPPPEASLTGLTVRNGAGRARSTPAGAKTEPARSTSTS